MSNTINCQACNTALNYTNGVAPKFCHNCGAKIDVPNIKPPDNIWIATGKKPVYMIPKMANRHGFVAGATGTGKTVTIKVLAEKFSDMGVPVFMGDIKGDVSGLCRMGEPNPRVEERVESMNIPDFAYDKYPVQFFDVYGKNGIPVRTTISDMTFMVTVLPVPVAPATRPCRFAILGIM